MGPPVTYLVNGIQQVSLWLDGADRTGSATTHFKGSQALDGF